MQWARESIIVSAVRSFCTSFAAILGVLIGIIIVLVCLTTFSSPDIFPPKSHLQVAADAHGHRELLDSMTPVLLRIDIRGTIGEKDLTLEKIENSLFDSQEGMLKGHRVHGVLLYINSPGGSADDSAGIYRALLEYKKKYNVPIYAFVDGLCASGGMYIACAADKIYATSSSIIGSVGVILGPLFNFSSLMDQYGVKALNLTQGKDKDMMSPYRPWQPGEDVSLRDITAALYHQFVAVVAEARPELTPEKLVNDYGAQVYVADKAQEYGYIDVADADYAIAVGALAKTVNLEKYQVMTIAPMRSILSDLMQNKFALLRGKITHSFPIAPYINSELSGRFLYLYQP